MSNNFKVSVVVPTCHRPAMLRRCLEQLRPGGQTIPAPDYEVIVADDSLNRETQDLLGCEFPWVQYTTGPRRGPAANRNKGASLATGEWIAFTDDDCVPSTHWLEGILAAGAGVSAVEGRTLCTEKTKHPFEERIENTGGGVFWSCNIAVRRETFRRLGGFDETFGEPAFEDMEFYRRLLAEGEMPKFAPAALVAHPARQLSVRAMWARTLRIRWYSLYLLKVRPRSLEQNFAEALAALLLERCADLIRNNGRALREFTAAEWQRSLSIPVWNTVTFPLVLPWIVYWEFHFRRRLRNRNDASARPSAVLSMFS